MHSRYDAVDLAAEITDRVRTGELFATFSDPARRVNRVTGPHQDVRARTGEYQVTAVDVQRGDFRP